MSDIAKINNDFATLFQEGKQLLEKEGGIALNSKREEAFKRFEELGGVPYKTEDYLYTNLLPVFDKDYHIV
ncbi:MAG: Fe-S cluster assembly protein SufD, partial [Odoribacter sp.]|nr:Fe-S cluster assembly protein SufD [Odoribacter sp.]